MESHHVKSATRQQGSEEAQEAKEPRSGEAGGFGRIRCGATTGYGCTSQEVAPAAVAFASPQGIVVNHERFRHAIGAAAFFAVAAAAPSRAAPILEVSVDLVAIAPSMAKRMNIDESRMPLSLLVPASVASKACGLAMSSLPAAGCRAGVDSPELDRLLAARMRADAPPPEAPGRLP